MIPVFTHGQWRGCLSLLREFMFGPFHPEVGDVGVQTAGGEVTIICAVVDFVYLWH